MTSDYRYFPQSESIVSVDDVLCDNDQILGNFLACVVGVGDGRKDVFVDIPGFVHECLLLDFLACLELPDDLRAVRSGQRVALEVSVDLAGHDIGKSCGAGIEGNKDDVAVNAVGNASGVHSLLSAECFVIVLADNYVELSLIRLAVGLHDLLAAFLGEVAGLLVELVPSFGLDILVKALGTSQLCGRTCGSGNDKDVQLADALGGGVIVLVSYFSVDDDWTSQTKALSQDTTGMILLATELGEERIKKLMENEAIRDLWSRIPVVLVDNSADTLDIDSVKSDNFRGGRIAADYLFDRGYADVGYLRSTTHITSFDERGRGLMASRAAHGVGKDKPLSVIDVGSSSIQAEKDMDAYLDAGNKPAPAYFADNDIIAAACIHSLKDHGYRVPEDVSVIGFDDMPLCTLFEPPLTTIGVKKTTIGRIAMGLLRRRIEDGQTAVGDRAPDACLRITLSTRLIVRGSVI